MVCLYIYNSAAKRRTETAQGGVRNERNPGYRDPHPHRPNGADGVPASSCGGSVCAPLGRRVFGCIFPRVVTLGFHRWPRMIPGGWWPLQPDLADLYFQQVLYSPQELRDRQSLVVCGIFRLGKQVHGGNFNDSSATGEQASTVIRLNARRSEFSIPRPVHHAESRPACGRRTLLPPH
jgi:hypothetical protein